eukprot:g235.t1
MFRARAESSHPIHSDEEETIEGRGWNGNVITPSTLDMDLIVSGQDKNSGREDGKDGIKREQLADHDFFNSFQDDFDEDDMKLKKQ